MEPLSAPIADIPFWLLCDTDSLNMTCKSEDIVGLYQRRGREWAGDRGTKLYEKAWLDRFLALLPANATILDLGCGSGEPIGRYLIGNGCSLTGVDSSPELIAMCKESFPAQDWHTSDMRTFSIERYFCGILAWDSFFHLNHSDQRQMFSIFRDHAASRAALMFTSGPSHGEAIGNFRGEAMYHASLDTAEYTELLKVNGFAVVQHVIEDPTCGRRTIWLSQSQ